MFAYFSIKTYEQRHDKTNNVAVRPAKIQISLGIRPVWSESSLSARRKLRSLAIYWAHSKDSDQTGRMPRLIWVFTGRTVILLVLSYRGSYIVGTHYNHLADAILMSTNNMSPVKRICVFEHSVMTNFNSACPAIQRGQGSGFLSEGSSWFTACMSYQRRFWRDCANTQARLNLRCLHRQ